MLGDIGFGDAERLYKILYRHLLFTKKVQDLETLRIGEDLVRFRISAIGSSWKRLLYFFS